MIDEIFKQYVKKFKEAVPVYSFPANWDDNKICDVLAECIDKGKPYEPEYEEDCKY